MEGVRGVVEYDISRVRGPLANAFIILLNVLFFNIRLIGLEELYPQDFSEYLSQGNEDIFDFIIVGAGSAGCSLANSLTEDGLWSVLLLEAGDYPSVSTEVPAIYRSLIGTSEDWNFHLEKDEKACKALQDQVCRLSRGKVVGGTSTINDLLYIRGTTQDYDSSDFESWGSNMSYTVLERLENFKGILIDNTIFGDSGLIHLDHANFTRVPKKILQHAYRSVGLTRLPHKNDLGYQDHLLLTWYGERANMAKNFLSPIKYRHNLYFSKNSEVHAVGTTEPHDKRATGVTVKIRDEQVFIRAKKEVILTAGAINNAKILLLSGIGPRDYLQSKGITPYINIAKVGKNLKFHLVVPLYMTIEPPHREFYTERDLVTDTFDYIVYRTGNLSHTNINEFVAYISTDKLKVTYPNIGIHHMYFKIDDRNLLAWVDSLRYDPRIISSLTKYNREKSIVVFLIQLLHPVSSGELYLNETHHQSNPRIVPKFFSDPDNSDFNTILSGFDFVANLTEVLQEVNAEILELDIPGCKNFKFCSMAYVKCYIQNMAYPTHDVIGSTYMGPDCDKNAVVKEDLELRGVRCLRVADSSVMGDLPIGNTVAMDAMIGFRMGEILKQKWSKDYHSEYLISPENPQQLLDDAVEP